MTDEKNKALEDRSTSYSPDSSALKEELARQQAAHAERTDIQDKKGPPMPSVGGLVSSTSDQRIVNNVMRHEYRVLSDVEKAQMKRLKDLGEEFIATLHNIGGTLTEYHTKGEDARQASRNLSLAQTYMEDAVMRAVRHVTG